ncbi:uncharacterized protein V6R79_011441 [Siganus canaliculatus]
MLFHSPPTRGRHVMATARGGDSLDSTKLHRTKTLAALLPLIRKLCMTEASQDPPQLTQCTSEAELRHVAGQQTTVEWDCSRWERDVEEGSRRLAMAHSEIRRLTDELESAHMTQRTYEPELQAAQQEVEQLRHEVEKLKKYEIVELRKAKELNDRLDIEIRALRDRVRSLDAEKRSLQNSVVSLQEKLEKQESSLQEHPHPTQLVQVASLQREVEQLKSALQEQQHVAEQQILILQVQAHQAHESAECQATELSERKETCRDFQNKMTIQSGWLSAKESEIHSLKHQLDKSQKELSALITIICGKDNHLQHQQGGKHNVSDSQHGDNTHDQSQHLLPNRENPLQKDCPDYQEVLNTLFDNQDKCETLEKEICETLKCLDKERSKCHEMKEKHKARLCRAKQKFDDETTWRDEKIKNLERELSLCSHSLAKEKELNQSITVENDKLLVERRKLLRQLSEEEENKMHSLEMQNKELRTKIGTMSKQFAALDHNLQNVHSLHFAEELKKIFTSFPVPALSGKKTELPEDQDVLDNNQARNTMSSSPHLVTPGPLSGSVELGYLNVTSTQSCSDPSALPDSISSSDSTFC